jgi:DNA-binding SARP family transcriptional activator
VSATCPNGHTTETPDYCSICGAVMPAPSDAPVPQAERCPNCGSAKGTGTACGECGFVVGAPDSSAPWVEENWEVVVRPDREFYDLQEPGGTGFPEKTSSRRIPLMGDHIRIGRRSKTKAIRPDIDLSDTLEDTGVSHHHAVLLRQPEGHWALVDQESTNGTYLNDDHDPVPPNQPVALSDGDRIHVGAWTTLTIERLDAPEVAPLELESRPSKDTRNLAPNRRHVEVDLLGPLRLRVRGEEVAVTAPKERALLSLLALRIGTPVPTPDVEWALWGDDEPKTVNKALQMHVSGLRKHLPADAIETTAQGYRLQGPKDSVDVFRFERLSIRGRTLLTSGHPGLAVAELSRALDLWRGEPLVELAGGPSGTAEVVGLRERKGAAEEDLFEGRLQLGQHQDVVADLHAAVEAEPLRERRWAQLMLALYRSGRKAEAGRAFQRLHHILVEECGLEPSTEVVALDHSIALDRPELQWTPPSQAGEAPPPTAA